MTVVQMEKIQGSGIWKDGEQVAIFREKMKNKAYAIRAGQLYKAQSNQATEASLLPPATAYENVLV